MQGTQGHFLQYCHSMDGDRVQIWPVSLYKKCPKKSSGKSCLDGHCLPFFARQALMTYIILLYIILTYMYMY